MDTVQDYLRRNRFSSQLIEQVESGAVKCRLVFEGESARGVFVHSREPKDTVRTLPRCIEIYAIGLIGAPSTKDDMSSLFDAAIRSARDEGARSISLKAKSDDPAMIRHLLSDGYKEVDRDSEGRTFGRSLLDAGVKRKADDDAQPIPPRVDRGADRPIAIARSAPIGSHNALRVTLKDQYVRQMLSGSKTVEGRINAGMFRGVHPGQKMVFFSQQTTFPCVVKQVISYPSFAEMLRGEGYQKCVSEAKSFEEAVRIYDSIPGYRERAAQNGVLALRIEKQ